LQVVWFKRDLRVFDHAPLASALRQGAVLPLVIDEASILFAQDQSLQHGQFREECLEELRRELLKIGAILHRECGEAVQVLEKIWTTRKFSHLWSHEETGNALTYRRDLAVRAWCKTRKVEWIEYRQFGVIRRLKSRDGWSNQWDMLMRSPCISPIQRLSGVVLPKSIYSDAHPFKNFSDASKWTSQTPKRFSEIKDKPQRQRGGRKAALMLLSSFLEGRGANYSKGMSSPLSAEMVCSRLSPHLSQGTVSIREIVHALQEKRVEIDTLPIHLKPKGMAGAMRAFESRLYWHCHFIQKLESQPSIEFENIHRGFDGMRETQFDASRFQAWSKGETGYPMIDACMRMLAQTGWINFRMRAMLASFSAYQLWLHWREPALHLAREFLDYEPGIHYSQIQMQSGVTGINTPRMYNPVKQARDQDPDGMFVKRWIPELQSVPHDWIFEPWLMPPSLQNRFGLVLDKDYPSPIVDHEVAAREAKQRLSLFRQATDFRSTAKKVLSRHGSRQSNDRNVTERKKKTPSTTSSKAISKRDTQGTFDFG
jgi:deoxyribodipyrimidine photo-lyase